MATHPFQTVDVFPSDPLSGNPLAVVFEADDLSTEEMMQITRWFNLSETTFVLPPTSAEADYRVRIFTLDRELPFAGHPTLGTCHAWLKAGGQSRDPDRVSQECGAGLIQIRRGTDRLSFAAPPLIRSGPVEDAKLEEVISVLRVERDEIVDSQWADNGPGWVAVLLESADAVLRVEPIGVAGRPAEIGIVGPNPPGGDVDFEVRAIFSDQNGKLVEDPVTGSLNASVAQWLSASGRATLPYVASQGTALGRAGRIYLDGDDDGMIWVGGDTMTHVTGTFTL
jgi:PhzF family phenazine biosynthesis protein